MYKKFKVNNKLILYMWIIILMILYIKSVIVLFTIYSKTSIILIFGFISIIPVLFFVSFSFILSQKTKLFYMFFLDFLISLIFFIDIIYARAFGHLISLHMIIAENIMSDLGPSILSLIKWTDYLLFLDVIVLLVLAIRINGNKSNRKIKFFLLIFFLTTSIIYYQFVSLESSANLGNYKLRPLQMSPLGYHMFDIYRFIYEKREKLNVEEKEEIHNWLDYNTKFQNVSNNYKGLKKSIEGKNIIVIQFESLENFIINYFYYGQEITPNINRLVDNSIYFNNIVEQVRDGNSSDAELLFNVSLYPMERGSAFLRFADNKYITLPKLLDELGYTSVAIHGDEKEFWNRNEVFPNLGYDKYIGEEEFTSKEFLGMGILDEYLFDLSLKEMKKTKEPFNFFIITLTSHMPFLLEEDIKHLNFPNDSVSNDYLQSIHYTDKVFGDFYNQLEKEGILNNSVLILYGDHEGVHKYYETTLPDNNYRIPFIIHIPGLKKIEIDKIGGQVDIMPTLAYLIGIEREKYERFVMGRNLFGENSGSGILSSGKLFEEADDKNHLKKGLIIADKYIRSNYYKLVTD